jgi:fatty acid elongase 3
MMQIIQFVIDLFVVYFGSGYFFGLRGGRLNFCPAYSHFAATYYDGIVPHIGNCAGSETAALFGCGLLTSYLGLFINFYLQTYKKKDSKKTPRTNGVTNGVANGHANGKMFVVLCCCDVSLIWFCSLLQSEKRVIRVQSGDHIFNLIEAITTS